MLQQPSIPSTMQSGLTVTKPRLPAVRTTSRKMGESENHTYHFQDMKSIQCLTSMIGEVEEDTLALGLWHRRSHHTRPPCTDMSLATLWKLLPQYTRSNGTCPTAESNLLNRGCLDRNQEIQHVLPWAMHPNIIRTPKRATLDQEYPRGTHASRVVIPKDPDSSQYTSHHRESYV